ncbi:hypothetical protein DPEC_G00108470 [Dallia pectoralis]|uniref:Uncharacterized protein n=1 Tax=Dallia pectoralis TaxID=75939 RepID=A0ACC2GSB3_DALPE|nr:hypothetical protein DPEC_G00108470 [Dallia pectoralis]
MMRSSSINIQNYKL